MAEPIIYLGISFLFAGLIAWAVMPLVRSRTARLTAQERDAARHMLSQIQAELDIQSQLVTHLKREREMLKSEIDALRSKLGAAAGEVPTTKPWSTGLGPLFVKLDPDEREQFGETKETLQGTQEPHDGAHDETGEPRSLRIVKNGSK